MLEHLIGADEAEEVLLFGALLGRGVLALPDPRLHLVRERRHPLRRQKSCSAYMCTGVEPPAALPTVIAGNALGN